MPLPRRCKTWECRRTKVHSGSSTTVSLVSSHKPPTGKFSANFLADLVSDAALSGAQVGVAAFAVNFFVDQGVGISQSKASDLFSFCQITFTVGR